MLIYNQIKKKKKVSSWHTFTKIRQKWRQLRTIWMWSSFCTSFAFCQIKWLWLSGAKKNDRRIARNNKIFTKMWGVYSLSGDTVPYTADLGRPMQELAILEKQFPKPFSKQSKHREDRYTLGDSGLQKWNDTVFKLKENITLKKIKYCNHLLIAGSYIPKVSRER